MKIPGSPSRARDAVGRTRTSRNSLVPLICSVSWTCLRSRPMNCLLWNEGLLGVAVERASDTLADLHAAIGPQEGGGMGNVEGHPEVPGQAQKVGRALAALLGPGLVRVVEVAAVQPHGLDADHHGPAQGIGHGRVQEVIPKGPDNLLDGEA